MYYRRMKTTIEFDDNDTATLAKLTKKFPHCIVVYEASNTLRTVDFTGFMSATYIDL